MIVCGYSYSHVFEVHYLYYVVIILNKYLLVIVVNQSSLGKLLLRRIFCCFFRYSIQHNCITYPIYTHTTSDFKK